ncbi:MAG: TadG family pilus assembly protein [Planctomycetota bacterium]
MTMQENRNQRHRRRGAAAALVCVSLVVLVGMASLTVDVAFLYRARAEAQAAADAAAMAAAWQLMDSDRLTGGSDMTDEMAAARTAAAQYAALNEIINQNAALTDNAGNSSGGDVVVGYLANPADPTAALQFGDTSTYNTVQVRVKRDASHGGPIDLFFAGVFGKTTSDVSAEAYAVFRHDINGFRPDGTNGNAGLLPFTVNRDAWNQFMAGTLGSGDNYTYDEATGTVSAGSDGISELNIYPGGAAGQLPPGNFGTVDFGNDGNSTADLARQIVDGVNEADVAAMGGEIALGADGTLVLNGDTGLSAGIKDELASIIGLPRTIPLFSTVSGNGNNSMFTITGFVGIRMVYVKLTGSASSKKVLVQPAFVVDPTGVASSSGAPAGDGDFVYRPVELIR